MLRRAKATFKCSHRPSQSWRLPASVAVTIMSEILGMMQAKQASHHRSSAWSVIGKLPVWSHQCVAYCAVLQLQLK